VTQSIRASIFAFCEREWTPEAERRVSQALDRLASSRTWTLGPPTCSVGGGELARRRDFRSAARRVGANARKAPRSGANLTWNEAREDRTVEASCGHRPKTLTPSAERFVAVEVQLHEHLDDTRLSTSTEWRRA
jgi:hypothetical protein